jgi:hypothetical protein
LRIFSKIRGDFRSSVDTGGKLTPAANLPPVSLTPVARYQQHKRNWWQNFPPVSTTLVKLVAKFSAGVVDTCGKFATGVVDILANISANFREIRNGPNEILWGWG